MLPIDYPIATPVSHHFENHDLARRLTTLSDALELRDNGIEPPPRVTNGSDGRGDSENDGSGDTYIYHSEADAASEWSDGERTQLAEIGESYDPALISLHLASRYQENELRDGRYVGIGEPYNREQLVTNVERNVEAVRNLFDDVPILLENNNHLGTDAYEIVTDPSFIDTAVRQVGVGLLLDVAHAKISARNTDTDVADYLSSLPLDRCQQVHLSRHKIGPPGAIDAHAFFRQSDWAYFHALQDDLPNLAYVTLEYYEDANVLADQLARMQTGESDIVLEIEQARGDDAKDRSASIRCLPVTEECLEYARVRAQEMNLDSVRIKTNSLREFE